MSTDSRRTITILLAGLAAALFAGAGAEAATGAAEDFTSLPAWASSFDAAWGGPATFSIVPGGQAGSALQATRGGGGSSARVLVYAVHPDTEYTLSASVRCPGSSSSYWAELAFRPGRKDAFRPGALVGDHARG